MTVIFFLINSIGILLQITEVQGKELSGWLAQVGGVPRLFW